jgi:hypothetical protein
METSTPIWDAFAEYNVLGRPARRPRPSERLNLWLTLEWEMENQPACEGGECLSRDFHRLGQLHPVFLTYLVGPVKGD